MKVLLTGATGFIGKRLIRKLLQLGIKPVVLTRNVSKAKEKCGDFVDYYSWDALSGLPPKEAFESVSAIINLMGEGIAEKRWTTIQKKCMWDTRVLGTKYLVEGALKFAEKLEVFISASAIGYYDHQASGDRYEESSASSSFMSKLCQAWEKESIQISEKKEIRELRLRIGLVLGSEGGALKKIQMPFKFGFGGVLGSGNQWMNWIHVEDLVNLVVTAIKEKHYSGVYNAVSPSNVTNKLFSQELASVLKKRNIFKVPALILNCVLGEMSAVVLEGAKVVPNRLIKAGFKFKYSELNYALKEALQIKFIEHLNKEIQCERFYIQGWLNLDQRKVFAFFSEAKNLDKITPSFLNFKITYQSTVNIQSGTLFDYSLKIRGIPISWRTEILDWNPDQSFVDTQLIGPYKVWHHTHNFFTFEKGTFYEDDVYFALPAIPIISKLAMVFVKRDVKKIFDFRKKVILDLL